MTCIVGRPDANLNSLLDELRAGADEAGRKLAELENNLDAIYDERDEAYALLRQIGDLIRAADPRAGVYLDRQLTDRIETFIYEYEVYNA